MTFLHPLLLWSLVALVPLAALYFLKVRPRRLPTTALFLWEQVLEERRSSSLFKRLRDVWSLLLLALACAAMCLASAQPEWRDQRQDLLVLVDNSASMGARDGGATRLAAAQRVAAEIVEGLNGNQRAAVASVARRLVYRSHLTDNPRELLAGIAAIAAAPEALQLGALPANDEAQNRYLHAHRVILISDGCFGAQRLPAHVELIKVGGAAENVGIIAADMAYLPTGVNQLALFYQIASSLPQPRAVDMTVCRLDEQGNEELAKVIPLEVKPGPNPPETFVLENAAPGRWLVRLDIDDALPEDNMAYLAVARPAPIRVSVQSDDRFFLEKSVQAFSRDAGLLTLVADQADVMLASGALPNHNKLVLLHPTGASPWWTDLGAVAEVAAPRVLVKDHPALRHVDAATIAFAGAKQLKPPAGAQILVADEHGLPLIYTARHEAQTALIVNLDPVAADFYFSAWFPVLVHSASTCLAGRENVLTAAYRPGDVVPIPAAKDDSVTTWTRSAAEPQEIAGKWLTLDQHLGFGELRNTAGQWFVGSSLLAPSETLLGVSGAETNVGSLSRGRSPTQWLTLLAIFVLVGEATLYHRRKVG